LDGWEDLTPEAQEKLKQALREGHVADEDWKGVRIDNFIPVGLLGRPY